MVAHRQINKTHKFRGTDVFWKKFPLISKKSVIIKNATVIDQDLLNFSSGFVLPFHYGIIVVQIFVNIYLEFLDNIVD